MPLTSQTKALTSHFFLIVSPLVFASAQVRGSRAAGVGICFRQGLGKLRHLDTSILWIQQKELRNPVEFLKVDGAVNPADLMTKNLAAPTASIHKETLRIEDRSGRALNANKLR